MAAGMGRTATAAARFTKEVWIPGSELPSAPSHCSSHLMEGKGSLGHAHMEWDTVARAPHEGQLGEGNSVGWI